MYKNTLGSESVAQGRCLMKKQYHEIFELWFFHHMNPFEPLIHTLKYFQIRF
jgi:hypothetical protein